MVISFGIADESVGRVAATPLEAGAVEATLGGIVETLIDVGVAIVRSEVTLVGLVGEE